MNNKNTLDLSTMLERLDFSSIVKDVLKSLWAVILGSLAVAMFINLYSTTQYHKTYTTTTTFVVSSQTSSSAVYRNLNAANTMAENFSNILNSEVLQNMVCDDLGLESFDAKVSSSIVAETNLITMRVTADSPYEAYRVTNSIIHNYQELTTYVTSSMVMQILQAPEVPVRPDTEMNVTNNMTKAAMVSFILFVLAFGVLSFRKKTIKKATDIPNSLGITALGTLKHEKDKRFFKFGKNKKYFLVNDATVSFDYVEHYNKIAVQLTSAAEKINAKTIVITSVERGEGKTTVAANLAITLAKHDHRVLLIDADMRHPMAAKIMKREEEAEKGFGMLVSEQAKFLEVLHKDRNDGLFFLFGDKSYSNSSELLANPKISEYIGLLRDEVDYIIIDTPCMSECADAEILAHETDMSVLVIQYDKVDAAKINDNIDILKESSPRLAGAILNDVRQLPGSDRTVGGYGGYGRYGYGTYGRYGYGKYGHYGKYGKYGKYGSYGHYAKQEEEA